MATTTTDSNDCGCDRGGEEGSDSDNNVDEAATTVAEAVAMVVETTQATMVTAQTSTAVTGTAMVMEKVAEKACSDDDGTVSATSTGE